MKTSNLSHKDPDSGGSQSRMVRMLAEMRFFSFSLFLHTVLVLVLGTVVLYQNREKPADFVSDGPMGLMADTSALAAPPEQPAEAQPTPSAESAAAPTVSTVSLDVVNTSAMNKTFTVSTGAIKPSIEGVGKGLGSKGVGMGLEGTGVGMGGGSAMRFFGTKATGKNVVLVVDVSGSMVRGTKSPKSYGELEKEVIRVIKDMDMKGNFGLIVFSRDAMSYRTHLVRATTEEKERACNWLKRQNPSIIDDPKGDPEEKAFHHGTRADLGLREAFNMKPDLIFFVSDGEPTGAKPDEVIQQVAAAQQELPKPAEVHTIAFLADGGQRFMKDLAGRNSGYFREVNPRDINQ